MRRSPKTPPGTSAPSRPSPGGPYRTVLILAVLFLIRLAAGIPVNYDFEDQKQVFLIGLKYFCTGDWPYFGADVVPYVQVPGALQGILLALPLKLWPSPEAPFLLVNLLSFAAYSLFAWYCCKRFPGFPRWIIWGWMLTAPWTLDYSTNFNNVSYIPLGSVLFFIGFLETIPAFSLGLLPASACNAMMGFSFFWIAQFHLSFTILAPFILTSFFFQGRREPARLLRAGLFLILGALPTAAFLLPTYLHYGFAKGAGGSERMLSLDLENFPKFFTILFRYLSFACFEVPRFIGYHTADRLEFLRALPWAAPFTLFTFLLGLAQPLLMLFSGFRKSHPEKAWRAMRILAFSTFLIIYLAYCFAHRSPTAHSYYLALPIAMLYSFFMFRPWASRKWFQGLALALLLSNLVFHAGLLVYKFKDRSYFTDRKAAVSAIRQKDHRLYGERREHSYY